MPFRQTYRMPLMRRTPSALAHRKCAIARTALHGLRSRHTHGPDDDRWTLVLGSPRRAPRSESSIWWPTKQPKCCAPVASPRDGRPLAPDEARAANPPWPLALVRTVVDRVNHWNRASRVHARSQEQLPVTSDHARTENHRRMLQNYLTRRANRTIGKRSLAVEFVAARRSRRTAPHRPAW